LIVKQAYFLLM